MTRPITKRSSVTTTIARSLMLILLLSVSITGYALITLASSLNDAAIVNVAGSLRMQSYRLAYDIVTDSPRYETHINRFDESLLSSDLTLLRNWGVPTNIEERYNTLISRWSNLKPELISPDRRFYLEQVALFVNDIDEFVFELQRHSENKLRLLAAGGGLGLILILFTALFLMRYAKKEIVTPLKIIADASQRIQNKQFDIDLPPAGNYEMELVSNSFSLMAKELKGLYSDLEQKIEEKTLNLTKTNRSLQILYKCSTQLSSRFLTREDFETMLNTLLTIEGMKSVRMTVNQEESSGWKIEVGIPDESKWVTKDLLLDGTVLGSLQWQTDITVTDLNLIPNVAMILSRGVYYNQAQKQAMQLAVMEERATIARELHDSLAQSLSYLKIQTTLLKRKISLENDNDSVEILDDINEQLRAAYNQLRELLTTFRMTLNNSDFGLALDEMLDALRAQTSVQINVDNRLDSISIDAQQQVHTLQIIREASLNAIKHSEATKIDISCSQLGNIAEVSIADDGKGFDTQGEIVNVF